MSISGMNFEYLMLSPKVLLKINLNNF